MYTSRAWPFNKIQSGWQTHILARSIHKQNPFHLIHSFWLSDTAILGAIIGRQLQVPHLTTLMGQDVRKTNRYRALFTVLRLNLVALTSYQAHFLPHRWRTSLRSVIGWGIDPMKISKDPRTIDVLGVGSLTQNKDFKTFIEIIAHLRIEFPSIKAVVIGEGQERASLLELIRKNRLENQIEMLGHLSRAEVIAYMVRSRILLHTSQFEGYGYVFVEALAAGCHIVSRRVGLAADIKHERWSVADSQEGLASLLSAKLKEQLSHTPMVIELMKNTVARYCELYRSMAESGMVEDESLS